MFALPYHGLEVWASRAHARVTIELTINIGCSACYRELTVCTDEPSRLSMSRGWYIRRPRVPFIKGWKHGR